MNKRLIPILTLFIFLAKSIDIAMPLLEARRQKDALRPLATVISKPVPIKPRADKRSPQDRHRQIDTIIIPPGDLDTELYLNGPDIPDTFSDITTGEARMVLLWFVINNPEEYEGSIEKIVDPSIEQYLSQDQLDRFIDHISSLSERETSIFVQSISIWALGEVAESWARSLKRVNQKNDEGSKTVNIWINLREWYEKSSERLCVRLLNCNNYIIAHEIGPEETSTEFTVALIYAIHITAINKLLKPVVPFGFKPTPFYRIKGNGDIINKKPFLLLGHWDYEGVERDGVKFSRGPQMGIIISNHTRSSIIIFERIIKEGIRDGGMSIEPGTRYLDDDKQNMPAEDATAKPTQVKDILQQGLSGLYISQAA